MSYLKVRQEIESKRNRVFKELTKAMTGKRAVVIVKAPPGSGKTHLLVDAVIKGLRDKLRVAIATQTNAQADEICERLAQRKPAVPCVRFVSSGATLDSDIPTVTKMSASKDLPLEPCIVVATTSKWEFVLPDPAFDLVVVDEAWQMPWYRFMGLGNIASRFVLIGDPGQIPPVVTADASRWEIAPRPPHRAAPEVILGDSSVKVTSLELPASRRLPHDSVQLIQPFYEFSFGSYAGPGERRVEVTGRGRDAVDKALDLLATGSVSGLTLPCPDGSPPLEVDEQIAEATVELALRALARKARAIAEDGKPNERTVTIGPEHIGVAATHRVMNARIAELLSDRWSGIRVDTPERWQGLERPIMIIVHPLSGVAQPTSFDLETGRLCVLASRHRGGLVVVSRDHVRASLEGLTPTADQAVGRPDVNGRGHDRHLGFWRAIEEPGRIASM